MTNKRIFASLLLVLGLMLAGCTTPGGEQAGAEAEGSKPARAAVARAKPLLIPAGTEIDVRLTAGLSSETNSAGDTFEGTLDTPLVVGDRVAVPKGAEVKGKVVNAVHSGRLKQRAELWVTLTQVNVKGKTYEIATSTTGQKEGSKVTRNILFIGGGGGAGAAIGGAAGGGKGAGIGAAIGAGAGTAAAMATGKRDIKFPPETLLRFQLEQPLTIQP